MEVGISLTSFIGVSAAVGVYGGWGNNGPFFRSYYVLGGQLTEQPFGVGIGVSLSIAGLRSDDPMVAPSVNCALGYGVSVDPGFSFLDTMAAGCVVGTGGVCAVIAGAAAFVDAGFGLTTGFACHDQGHGYADCLSKTPQLCNIGVSFSFSAEIDIVPIFDFSFGFGHAIPFHSDRTELFR